MIAHDTLEIISFALPEKVTYEPIVNMRSGLTYGFELMNLDIRHFTSTEEMSAYLDLISSEMKHEATDRHFRFFFRLSCEMLLKFDETCRIVLAIQDAVKASDNTMGLLTRDTEASDSATFSKFIAWCKSNQIRTILDNFGQGHAEAEIILKSQPDLIRLSKTFSLPNVDQSRQKFVSRALINFSHIVGIKVIALGVSNETSFFNFQEIDCDFLQGDYIHDGVTHIEDIKARYDSIQNSIQRNRRQTQKDSQKISEKSEVIPVISETDGMDEVFEAFRKNQDRSYFPVVDSTNQPLGVIREARIKEYIYSKYGRDLIRNKAYSKRLVDLMSPCPIADINQDLDKLLSMISAIPNAEGIILTENHAYVGFLSAQSLLVLLHEKNLELASDQNPLTKLPGNNSISEYITERLSMDTGRSMSLVYFDFNDFKPFNDYYGFRQGDRAIMLFADIIRRSFGRNRVFLAHIGGDDFFAAFRDEKPEQVEKMVERALKQFKLEAESFYDFDARVAGFIETRGRDGVLAKFNLLSCCAAIIHLTGRYTKYPEEELFLHIAKIKKKSKSASDNIATKTINIK